MRRAFAALMLIVVSALALAACGGDSSSSDTAATGTTAADTRAAKTGGTLTGYLSSSPDSMDPALAYTQEGTSLLWTVYTPLLTYRHAAGATGSELIPGLAESLPQVSADGKTYRLKLRPNLTYSDGTPVKASDFEHAIKRVLNLQSPGSSFYLPIVGAEDYLKNGKADADIPGIVTDDATGEITIKLTSRTGAFPYALAMTFAGLVPSSTPFKNLTADPPPGVGPYMVTSAVPNREITLKRNPSFAGLKIPDIPTGNVDGVDMTIVKNKHRQVEDVIDNKVDYVNDPPPPDMLREVKDRAGDRFAPFVTNSTYFFFLNNSIAPFNDERVRQAVNYAIDKRALQRIFGGLLAPSCNFLPPGMKGYEKIDPCPYGDPTQAPDVAKAKQLIQDAGATGAKVDVWGYDLDPAKPATEYFASVLNDIGLDATPKIIQGSVYFPTVGSAKTKAQAGFANFFQDYPHPSNFMAMIDGKVIQPTNSPNFGHVDDPEINELIATADASPDLDAVAGDYAKADRLAVEHAYLVPYGNRELTKLVSDKVDFNTVVAHPVYNVDLTQIAFK